MMAVTENRAKRQYPQSLQPRRSSADRRALTTGSND